MYLLNKTTRLILPMAFYDKGIKGDDILATDGFINAFIGDVENPEFDNKILMVYDDKQEAFDIPKEFENDYWKIVCSQYQEVDPNYMKFVKEFWNYKYDPPRGPYDEFEIFEEVYNMGVE